MEKRTTKLYINPLKTLFLYSEEDQMLIDNFKKLKALVPNSGVSHLVCIPSSRMQLIIEGVF